MTMGTRSVAMSSSQSIHNTLRAENAAQDVRPAAPSSSRVISANLPGKTQDRSCDACHKRHRRCAGGVPCKLCVEKGTDCKFDRPGRRSRLDSLASKSGELRNDDSSEVNISLPALGFTQSQLSLALSLQRSRPPHLTAREYCLHLRKRIKTCKAQARGEHAYVDTAEFWKDQYTKLYSDKRELEVQNARLELMANSSSSQVPFILNLGHPSRCVSHNRKTPATEDLDLDLDELMPSSKTSVLHGFENINCLPLLKKAQTLHKLLGEDGVSSDVLSTAILSSVSYSTSIVGEICDSVTQDLRYWTEFALRKVIQSLEIVAAVFNIGLRGLSHLCRDITGRRCKGQIIYSLVQFFVGVLDHTRNLCTAQVSLHPNQPPLGIKSENMARISSVIRELSRFLGNILISPEFQKSNVHCFEVLEGIIACMLDRIGRLVSQTVFTENLALSKRPGCISSPDHDPSILPANQKVVEVEGHALLLVLKYAMVDNGDNRPIILTEILRRTNFSVNNPKSGFLIEKSRNSLQKTLLRGIFGENSDDFRDALKVPKHPEEYVNVQSGAQESGANTFIESVYSIVGWDTLLS